MNAHDTRERDPTRVGDSIPATVSDDTRREIVLDRLAAVTEPSSSVDHLLEYLAGTRPPTRMRVVDWVLPLPRTDGGVALRVVRSAPNDDVAYLAFSDDRFVATPWRTAPVAETTDSLDHSTVSPVAPREWFPDDAKVEPVPIEMSPVEV